MSIMEGAENLKISLEEIKLATNNFCNDNIIGHGGYGKVYKGELNISGQQSSVAVKKLDGTSEQGKREFWTEIQVLSCYKHKNLVSLVGFCDEAGEMIIVYEYENRGSLDKYLSDPDLSWTQRLHISLGVACGLNYLHNDVGPQHRVLHRDIKSANILLNDNWESKISDFGLSKLSPSHVPCTFLVTRACGTDGYVDPQYIGTDILTKENDVYAFGVVLFEILCGQLAYIKQGEHRLLGPLAQQCYEEDRLHEIIHANLVNQRREVDSFKIFSKVAYQCLKKDRRERPTTASIVENLEKALNLESCSEVGRFIQVGTWGRQSGSQPWSFELEEGHNLLKMTIDHGDVIYSVMFTSDCGGVLDTPIKVGGLAGGDKISEVTFDGDERIICVRGTIGTRDGYTVISSLSFQTNKRTHGPFGQATNSTFFVPWDEGLLGGFYGLVGNYVDAIGVYVKASEEIIKVGTWGCQIGGAQNIWSFHVEKNHHLKKITIQHGDLIHSLMFTTEYKGLMHNSKKAGGQNGLDKVSDSEVIFDWDEEIKAINGIVGLSREENAGHPVISSLSFVTNKKTHGPFGRARGRPFTIPLENGSFAGFYGLAAYYIDSIGVYLKASI